MSDKFVDIEVEGFAELRDKIKRLSDDKSKTKEVRRVLMQIAKPTQDEAKRLAPVGDGFVTIKGKRYKRKSHVVGSRVLKDPYKGGEGKASIQRKIMTRANIPMVTVSPRSRKSADGFYLRQFVIRGHNIYRGGFKRSRKGSKAAPLEQTRKYNASGAKSRVPGNPFMDKAYNRTKGLVTATAERKMVNYFRKQINRLSR